MAGSLQLWSPPSAPRPVQVAAVQVVAADAGKSGRASMPAPAARPIVASAETASLPTRPAALRSDICHLPVPSDLLGRRRSISREWRASSTSRHTTVPLQTPPTDEGAVLRSGAGLDTDWCWPGDWRNSSTGRRPEQAGPAGCDLLSRRSTGLSPGFAARTVLSCTAVDGPPRPWGQRRPLRILGTPVNPFTAPSGGGAHLREPPRE